MKQNRITRKAGDEFWTIQRKVWWGWKYDSYAVNVHAALDYINQKLKEEKK